MKNKNIIQQDFDKLLGQIPDKILKSFTKRSIRDAKKLIGEDINISEEELSDISYTIFRAYCIGFALGNITTLKK